MKKILTIVGARPQFIKASAISRVLTSKYFSDVEEVMVHTGQHYDHNMSDVFFKELGLKKEKYNLNIGSSSHAVQTAQMMIEIDKVIDIEDPDAVLLYGDTNSTLASCIVAVKRHIPIIHIEAGVRSHNKKFPEEVNRLICDHVSSMLFVPTYSGIDCLRKEGLNDDREHNYSLIQEKQVCLLNSPLVYKCGDIMYDNTLFFQEKANLYFERVYQKNELPKHKYVLVTAHRPSNVDDSGKLKEILRFFHFLINDLGLVVVFPTHPRTKKIIEQSKELKKLIDKSGIYCIPPVSFIEMVGLEKNAELIVTDSGGVQKEAYFMNKPCLIMLEETPWVELLETGNAKLVGNNYDSLCKGAKDFIERKNYSFKKIYGDGNSAKFICEKIYENLVVKN